MVYQVLINDRIQERFVVAQLDEKQNGTSPTGLNGVSESSNSETNMLNNEEEILLVTGSRLRTGIFNDDLPIQVLDVELGKAISSKCLSLFVLFVLVKPNRTLLFRAVHK